MDGAGCASKVDDGDGGEALNSARGLDYYDNQAIDKNTNVKSRVLTRFKARFTSLPQQRQRLRILRWTRHSDTG